MPLAAVLDLAERFAMGLASRWRNAWLRARGVRIGQYCWLRAIEVRGHHSHIALDGCALDRGVVLLCPGDAARDKAIRLRIGPGAYLNRGTFVDALRSVTIGRDTAIGPGCYITDHDHGPDRDRTPLGQPMVAVATAVGDRCWLGAHVTVLKGVTIGDGTIVGAGSVVTRSLPPDVIAVGIPARVVRQRLGPEPSTAHRPESGVPSVRIVASS